MPRPAQDAPGWRIGCLAVGISLAAIGVFSGPRLLAAYLSADGHITEVAYVTGFQLLFSCGGLLLCVLGITGRLRTIQNLAAIVIGLVVAFAVIEESLRAVDAYSTTGTPTTPTGLRRTEYPGLFYENTPSFYEHGELTFNSLGMRDEERVIEPGRSTVVVVGDSIEAWRDLSVRELYPRRLEHLLSRRTAEPIQVLNFGVSGYSLHQKVLMVRYRGLKWHPALVVVGYCLNDPIPAWELVNYFTDQPRHRPLRTVEFVSGRLKDALHNYGLDFYSQVHRPGTEEWRGVERDLQILGEIQKESQTHVLLLIFPLMVDTSVDYPWRDIHSRVSNAARQNGLIVVDLLESFRGRGFPAVRADTVHPNALGHLLAAEQIDAAIARLGLLSGPGGRAGTPSAPATVRSEKN